MCVHIQQARAGQGQEQEEPAAMVLSSEPSTSRGQGTTQTDRERGRQRERSRRKRTSRQGSMHGGRGGIPSMCRRRWLETTGIASLSSAGVCVCTCVCVCVCACVRACVCVCVRACVLPPSHPSLSVSVTAPVAQAEGSRHAGRGLLRPHHQKGALFLYLVLSFCIWFLLTFCICLL